jgi:gas vesicle protein
LPRVLAALLLALTFLSGAIIGVAADRALLLKQGRVLPREGMQLVSSHIVRAMDRELDLTEAQKASIAEILDQRKERIERIWFDVSPAVRSEIARSNAEIADQLTPLQREEFERIIARWERRVDRMIGPRAP